MQRPTPAEHSVHCIVVFIMSWLTEGFSGFTCTWGGVHSVLLRKLLVSSSGKPVCVLYRPDIGTSLLCTTFWNWLHMIFLYIYFFIHTPISLLGSLAWVTWCLWFFETEIFHFPFKLVWLKSGQSTCCTNHSDFINVSFTRKKLHYWVIIVRWRSPKQQ